MRHSGGPDAAQSRTGGRDVWKNSLATIAGLIAALLLVSLIFLVSHANRERDRALAHERHSYEILVLTRGLDATMARSEAALGRFVISGDKGTGTLYYEDWIRAGQLLHRLAELSSTDPAQTALVRDLKDLYNQRGRELAEPATRANFHQGWAALSLFNKAGESDAIDRMAAVLRKIEANEQSTLGIRADMASAGIDRSNLFSRWLSLIGAAMALAVLLFGWLAVRGFTQHRIAREEAERAELLEYAVAERTLELKNANEQLLSEAATRHEAEARLRQMHKMEAVGQLTGGIAHDFNNMLAVVIGGLDLARRRLTREHGEVRRQIDNAMDGANRAAALTRRLLSFARSEPLRSTGINPSTSIGEMSDLLKRTIDERISINFEMMTDPWLVWADPHQLENSIVNLAINARDAIDSVGSITIRTAGISLMRHEVGTLEAGEYVCVSVTDTGCGMSPDLVERAFEPFFTTKPVGKGTGLGLSQIFGFAQQSGGSAIITSAPGIGTSVSLYLPRFYGAEETAASRAPVVASVDATASDHGSVNILIVEDDGRVRAATVAGVEELGHVAIPCASGDEALTILAQRNDIAIVITDVVMPSMTGPELVERITPLYPNIGILFVTGYAGDVAGTPCFAEHDLLRKPFTIGALSAAIARAFDRISALPPAKSSVAA